MFRKFLVTSLSSFVFLAGSVFAVGLGDIEQSSGLNQPLNAKIKILSPGDLAEYEVVASIASQSAFDKSGIDKPFFLNKIKFKTVKNDRGDLVIKVTTHDSVKEPFLNFLIELNTPAQQFYREYTLLLDPPIFEDVTASTIEKTTSQISTTPQSTKPKLSYPNTRTNAKEQSSQADYGNNNSAFTGNQYGTVSSTDTLWSIASRVRPSKNVSIHQTLVAIYRANPKAFSKGNINNLLRGKVLNIPSEDAIQNVPQRAALQDVVMQNKQWRSGGARNIVDQTDDYETDTSNQNRGSRLSLATANSDENASGYGAEKTELKGLQDELIRTQEQSATLQAENDELRARLADIVANAEGNKNESGLVNVDDAELALLAKNESSDQSSNQDDSNNIENTGLESELNDEAQSKDVDDDTSVEKTADVKSNIPVQTPKPKEKSFIDSVLEGGQLLWGGITGIIVIILIVVFWRMKKRMEDDEFQDDLVASTGAGMMDTTEVFELPDVGDDMLVELDMDDDDDESTPVNGEAFDPLGEADIYIAYGKIDQAETLLLEAIEDNPIRSDYKVKLMECYAESDNKKGFEKLEAEVNDAVDADEWSEQVNLLRSKVWENESDDDEFDLPSTEDIFGDEDEDDFDIDLSEDSSLNEEITLDDEIALDEDSGDDFDLNFGEDDSTVDVTTAELDSLDDLDDLDSIDGVGTLDDSMNIDEDSEEIDDLDLDNIDLDELDDLSNVDSLDKSVKNKEIVSDEFELDLDDELSEKDVEENADELSIDIDNDEGITLDIDDDFDFAEDGDENIDFGETLSDEIATKLDLARAYVDMGDLEGAKDILAEVVADGTKQQKSEAQALIDKC